MTTLLERLIRRGNEVSIETGRLKIVAASGKSVPPGWFQEKQDKLIMEIIELTSYPAWFYVGYKTARYEVKVKSNGNVTFPGGVCLTLASSISGEAAFVIFNAELNRKRNTKNGKAGQPLPDKQFRISGERHHFYKFWKATELPLPKRLSSFHDFMGKLKGIVFTGTPHHEKKNRVLSDSLRPLTVSFDEIVKHILPDNCQTIPGQLSDNFQTRNPDKEPAKSLANKGLQPNQTTGLNRCVNKLSSKHIRKETTSKTFNSKPPHLQSVEEWLQDYELAELKNFGRLQ